MQCYYIGKYLRSHCFDEKKATNLAVSRCLWWHNVNLSTMDLLECPLCLFLMCEPVTMSCGHTFCRKCVGSYLPSKCPVCKERLKQREVRSMRNNVLLIGVVEKCCPDETSVTCHVQEKLKARDFTEALRIANDGLNLGETHMQDSTQKFLWIMLELCWKDGCLYKKHFSKITLHLSNSLDSHLYSPQLSWL